MDYVSGKGLKNSKIVKLDIQGRVQIPSKVCKEAGFEHGQLFVVDYTDGKVILTPIKNIKAVLDDGTIMEL